MSIYRAAGIYQGQREEFQELQDIILAKYPKAKFTIRISDIVSIKCSDYPDYIRYKAEILERTSLPIRWTRGFLD